MSGQIPGLSATPSMGPPTGNRVAFSSPANDEKPKRASAIPLVVCTLLLLLSLLIQVFKFQLGGGSWFYLGYGLTPVLSSLTLGWDSLSQRNGRKDPWFVPAPILSRIIRVEVGLSFVLGVFHILEIGTMCGQSFVQSGVLCA